MDKIRFSSFKFKVWEDKLFKIEKNRQAIHLADIKLASGKNGIPPPKKESSSEVTHT